LLPSQIERLSIFESSRHCPCQVPVAPSHLPFGQFLDLGFCIHAAASQSPHPPMVLGLKTSGSTKRSFSELAFFSPIITGGFTAAVFVFLPNRSHKDRGPIFRSAWRYDVLLRKFCRYPWAVARYHTQKADSSDYHAYLPPRDARSVLAQICKAMIAIYGEKPIGWTMFSKELRTRRWQGALRASGKR